jgi:hypothetical protein
MGVEKEEDKGWLEVKEFLAFIRMPERARLVGLLCSTYRMFSTRKSKCNFSFLLIDKGLCVVYRGTYKVVYMSLVKHYSTKTMWHP